MEKYILSLIKENNRVIIPNFGAFIVAKENGYTILFNNFLSFNDGLLIDYVSSTRSISKDEATSQVDKYVEKVKEELDSHGEYKIEGLGTFTKDATGILRFTQADEINHGEDAEKESDLLDLDSTEKEELKDEPEQQVSIETPEETKVNEEPLVEVEEEPEEKKEEAKMAVPEQKTTNITNQYIQEDKKRRNRSIFIFLIAFVLVPLIGVILYFTFFNKDKEPVKKVVKTQPVIKKEPKAEDSIKLDAGKPGEVLAGPEIKKQDKPAVIKPVEITKPHHIIVGSFKNVENAERYMKSLKAKGFDKCYAIQHNSMTLVSVESFAKVYEAQKRQEEILDSDRLESWILTKRK